MTMRRILALSLLGLGTLFGFTSGFRALRGEQPGWAAPWGMHARMDALAEACVRAARTVPPAVQASPAP